MGLDDDEGRVRVRSTLLTLAGGARALYCSTPASQAQVYNFHVRYVVLEGVLQIIYGPSRQIEIPYGLYLDLTSSKVYIVLG